MSGEMIFEWRGHGRSRLLARVSAIGSTDREMVTDFPTNESTIHPSFFRLHPSSAVVAAVDIRIYWIRRAIPTAPAGSDPAAGAGCCTVLESSFLPRLVVAVSADSFLKHLLDSGLWPSQDVLGLQA